jgi:hypothetical protein
MQFYPEKRLLAWHNLHLVYVTTSHSCTIMILKLLRWRTTESNSKISTYSTINAYFFCVFIGWQQGWGIPCSMLRISKCMSLTYYSPFQNHPSPAHNVVPYQTRYALTQTRLKPFQVQNCNCTHLILTLRRSLWMHRITNRSKTYYCLQMNERSNVYEKVLREWFRLENAQGVTCKSDTGYFPIP